MNYIFEREFAVTPCILSGESGYTLLNILEKGYFLLYSWTNKKINVSKNKMYMTCMNISEFVSTFPVCHAFVFIKMYDFYCSVYISRIVLCTWGIISAVLVWKWILLMRIKSWINWLSSLDITCDW